MCGRFTNLLTWREIVSLYRITEPDIGPNLPPRFNIAPSQDVLVVRAGEEGGRACVPLRWGLIPGWAKDPAIGYKMINARAETVSEKPSFRAAFRKRRCLIPASGFYEWQTAEGGKKQPFYIRLADDEPMSFAGLWERWQAPDGELVETCTIITTEANERISTIHHRMPAILAPDDHDLWLGADPPKEALLDLLRLCSYPADAFDAYPVSTRVNKPANDEPACIEQLA